MAAPKTRRKKAKSKAPAALAPRTGLAEPETQPRVVYVQRNAGVRVTEDTALTLGAVFACVRLISEDIAGLPWHVHEKMKNGGSVEVPEDPSDWLLHTQASPETPAFQWRETILAHALTWGNGYAEIERDGAGRPVWLWLITPDRVMPFRDGGEIWYEVTNPTGGPTYLPPEDMFHLRGLGFDGLVGYSVIRLAARSIGAGIALDQSTADLFANDSTPGGTLNHPGKLSNEARERLKTDWERRHMGPLNRRRVAILEEGLTWVQTGLPPEDSKLIEQRQFTPADVARWFRVKPHKIGDLTRSTYSNIESENTSHVTDTLLPWGRRLETEANIKLFGRTNRGRRYTKVDFRGFLRGDTTARWQGYKDGLSTGVYSINDVLALEDNNPIGPDGDKRFVPLNMQLLEKAGEEPPKPVLPVGRPPNPDDPEADPEAEGEDAPPEEPKPEPELAPRPGNAVALALLPVFEDACRRLLRVETERAKGAIKGGPEKAAAWFDKMRADHSWYVCTAIRPAASALALARGSSPDLIDAALGVVADRHMEGFRARLDAATSDPAAPLAWEANAGAMAATMIHRLSTAVEVTK